MKRLKKSKDENLLNGGDKWWRGYNSGDEGGDKSCDDGGDEGGNEGANEGCNEGGDGDCGECCVFLETPKHNELLFLNTCKRILLWQKVFKMVGIKSLKSVVICLFTFSVLTAI